MTEQKTTKKNESTEPVKKPIEVQDYVIEKITSFIKSKDEVDKYASMKKILSILSIIIVSCILVVLMMTLFINDESYKKIQIISFIQPYLNYLPFDILGIAGFFLIAFNTHYHTISTTLYILLGLITIYGGYIQTNQLTKWLRIIIGAIMIAYSVAKSGASADKTADIFKKFLNWTSVYVVTGFLGSYFLGVKNTTNMGKGYIMLQDKTEF